MIDRITTVSELVCNEVPKSCLTFEEAMNLTGFGKFNVYSMLFSGFILLGMILETLGFSYIIPACQCDLNLTLTQKGWLAAIPFICIILTSHMWGYLADTKGRKKVLVYSMSIGSFLSILSSFSPDLITFVAFRFLAGLFIAAGSALGYTYIGELNPKKHRDKMLALGNASVALGTAIVPLIAWGVLPSDFHVEISFLPQGYRPWRLLVAIFALPYAICSILFFKFPESPRFLQAEGNSDEALDILKYIYSINSGRKEDDFPITEIKCECEALDHSKNSFLQDVWQQTVPLFRLDHLKDTFLTCFLQFGTFAITNGFYIWFPAVLNKLLENYNTHTFDEKNMCYILSYVHDNNDENVTMSTMGPKCNDTLNTATFPISLVLSCVVFAITVSSAFLLEIFGKRNILIFILLLTGTSALIIHWITNMIASIVLFSILQICGTCIGIINAFVVEIFPTHVRAMAVCLTMMMGRVGSIFGTNIIGYFIEHSCPVSFFIFSGLLYVCAVSCLALPKSEEKKEEVKI